MGLVNNTSTSWELRSNKGGELIRWEFRSTSGHGDSSTLVCDLSVRASYWGQDADPRDVNLTIRQLPVRRAALETLEKHLRGWVDLPIAELAHTPLVYMADAGGMFDNHVSLSFGPRDDLIAERHPCVTLRYGLGKLAGEMSFVTDQSCIRDLCDGIRTCLAKLGTHDSGAATTG